MIRASIDLGTNTCLLLVIKGDRVLHDESRVVRLGQDVARTGRLHPEAMERARACLQDYVRIAERLGVSAGAILAVATAQARDASDAKPFFDGLETEFGLRFRILSGQEEARATFLGAALTGSDPSKMVVMDIGGGSTELVAHPGGESLPIGAVKISEKFLHSDPVTDAESRSRSQSQSRSRSQSRSKGQYSVTTSNLSYTTNREILLHQSDIYTIVRKVFIKNKAVFFGGYANILYSRYMPKHQRRIVRKIPDFDILSENPRELCEEVVRELTAHKYTDVKYTKHKGVGEVISEHYDIRVGDEVVAFLYKPLACHSYNTIKIDGKDIIRIATIDTMLSFYLAFIYADRIYYDINRILCMSQFLFDVQQHNRLKQTGLLRRFSINCYGKQPTLESMRFEKTKKYEELKGKQGTREYEEWFLRYIPLEHTKRPNNNKTRKLVVNGSNSKTRKRRGKNTD